MRNLLTGEKVRLTAIKDSELAVVEDWFNNVEFLRYYDYFPALPMSHKEVEELIKGFQDTNERYIFAIRAIDDGRIIGVAGFDDIIWTSGVASVFIGIGDDMFKGRGIGREALELLLDFGYNELNFYRIQLNVISYNEPAIRLYERAGFVREGICRNLIYRDGRRYDLYMYGMLQPEWLNAKNYKTERI